MTNNQTQEQPKKPRSSEVKKVGDNRYKLQRGKVIVQFELVGGKLTFVDKEGVPKHYTFIGSDPFTVREVGRALKAAGNFALEQGKKAAEAGNAAT